MTLTRNRGRLPDMRKNPEDRLDRTILRKLRVLETATNYYNNAFCESHGSCHLILQKMGKGWEIFSPGVGRCFQADVSPTAEDAVSYAFSMLRCAFSEIGIDFDSVEEMEIFFESLGMMEDSDV